MTIVIIIYVFIIGGFFVIAGAPWLKLYRKAGIPAWRALVPGLNFHSFVRLSGKRIGWFSVVSFLCLAFFWFSHGLSGLEENAIIPPDAFLVPAAILIASTYFTGFPLLSTSLLFSVAFLSTVAPPEPGLLTIVTVVSVAVALLQAFCDFLSWRACLKRLARPAWQIVFLFLPCLAMLACAAVILLARPAGATGALLGALYPTLLAGFVYLYYIAYSPKVLIATD